MFVLTGASIVVFALLSQPIITSWSSNKNVLLVEVLPSISKVLVGPSNDTNSPTGVNLYLPAEKSALMGEALSAPILIVNICLLLLKFLREYLLF